MKKADTIIIFVFLITYLLLLFFFRKDVLTYKFNPQLIDRYLRSQDIPHEVPGRLFLSDSDIHISAGYLYINGNNPATYNFQHPPLIKYLYGASILLTQNPFWIQTVFGLAYLFLTYFLGYKMFNSRFINVLSLIFLLFDPLLLDLSSQALLDLGQAVFALGFIILFLFYPRRFIFQGILFGLLLASKFWALGLFLILFLVLWKLFTKQKINFKFLAFSLLIASIIFSLNYYQSFIEAKGMFNLVFYQLKIFKYWLNHSISSFPGASTFLFTTGFFINWWGKRELTMSAVWSIFWPISMGTLLINLRNIRKRKLNDFIFVFPLLYLVYLGIQAPFSRYFIVILPFCYLGLSYSIWILSKKQLEQLKILKKSSLKSF